MNIEVADSLARILSSLISLISSKNDILSTKAEYIANIALDELGRNLHKDVYNHWLSQLNAKKQKTS